MNAWSLFEHTSPKNVFVFARHDVVMNKYNSYVVIAKNYNAALEILRSINSYFDTWYENGTWCRRMVQVWNITTRKEMVECRKYYMKNRHDYYTWRDVKEA